MAVGDTIVGITGTGTEVDPYLVTKTSEFLTCIQVPDAYVKLINDIYCMYDGDYKNGITYTPVISCRKLYSDFGNTIYGLKVTSTSFLIFDSTQGYGVTVENVNFLSCVITKTAIRYATIGTNAITDTDVPNASLSNCKFSLVQKCGSARNTTFIGNWNGESSYSSYMSKAYITIENCSFYCQFVGDNSSYDSSYQSTTYPPVVSATNINACYFYLLNMNIRIRHDDATYTYIFKNTINSTIVLDAMVYYHGSNTNNSVFISCVDSTCYSNVIVTLNCTCNIDLGSYKNSSAFYYWAESMSLVHNEVNMVGFGTVEKQASIIYSTLDQLKNQQYLISTGLVP